MRLQGSLPQKFQFKVFIHAGHGGWLLRNAVVLPVFHHIIHATQNGAADGTERGRPGFVVQAGGGREQGFADGFEEQLGKIVLRQPDGHASIGTVHRGCQTRNLLVQHIEWSGVEREQGFQPGMHGFGEGFEHIQIAHDAHHAGLRWQCFEGSYALDGLGVSGIASNAPDGVGRVTDDAALLKDAGNVVDIVAK